MQASLYPQAGRWAYYSDTLALDENNFCLGWIISIDGLNCTLRGYDMKAVVISLPHDTKVTWVKHPASSVVNVDSVMWMLPVLPIVKPEGEAVPLGSTPDEFPLHGNAIVPSPLCWQAARVSAVVLSNKRAEVKREARAKGSMERREKHKQRVRFAETPPRPTITKTQRISKPSPLRLQAILNVVDMEISRPGSPSLSFPDLTA